MRKKILASLFAFLFVVPSFAVLNEKDLSHTLSILRYELRLNMADMERYKGFISKTNDDQHRQLVQLMERCNELSLMLYSQKQDYTFDLTYALDEVTREYKDYGNKRLPYDKIVTSLNVEIERYKRLIHTLKCLPPALVDNPMDSLDYNSEDLGEDSLAIIQDSLKVIRDSIKAEREKVHEKFLADLAKVQMEARLQDSVSQFVLDSAGRADRDSCLLYAQTILDMYQLNKSQILDDNFSYDEANIRLKEAYDYAQARYKLVQQNIFRRGQTNYFKILRSFPHYWSLAMRDMRDKYSRDYFGPVHSEWRGPMVIGLIFFVLFYLILSIVLAALALKLLVRYVPALKTSEYTLHKPAFLLLAGSVIFAVSVMVARATFDQHFFDMASSLLVAYALMLAAISVSLLIRLDNSQMYAGMKAYFPIILLAIIIIFLRIIFIPNRMLNIVFPPLLAVFAVWQSSVWHRYRDILPRADSYYMAISFFILLTGCVLSCIGYVLVAVQVVIWWLFQLTFIQALTSIGYLISLFRDKFMEKRLRAYRIKNRHLNFEEPGTSIAITWFYDLVRMVVIPVAGVLSVPVSIFMAAGMFDLSEVVMTFMSYPFLNYENIIRLSVNKIVTVVSMYFLFKYLIYVMKAVYRIYKTTREFHRTGQEKIKANQLNLTLANNVISLAMWGLYIIIALSMLKIPTTALKTIGAGLAAGMGFAMKDILNNFFYGVQLMSGRLRVGDMVECDGVRGTVVSINYQTTEIQSEYGSIMAFPNANLFNKNFKNLTKNHSYELIVIPFGVRYGTNVDQVRKLILKALKPLQKKDEYGRYVVDPNYPVQVRFMGFGDNSVNLSVYQFVTVENKYLYSSRAREIIYNTLNENGIEIPFPQRDVYVKKFPEADSSPARE